ncbi:hypothetical protein PYW08_008747 [Mythimna loreyi]|uniref:Uncharacterized protein n=1 Tax=Mythimna loreyi TaxID=667449 RepID=A0ACC2Q9X0_9NEOP|nr:hypothetical protein PYW08_008747 [Mythimna loreyi]
MVTLCLMISFLMYVQVDTARILAVFPTPLISHQSAHRSIIHELVIRDHEVVLITPLPEYTREDSPDNLMEIDVSEITKNIWSERYIEDITGKNKYKNEGLKHVLQVATKIVEKQLEIPEVKSFIKNNETFDLLLLESWIRPTLFWTYIYDAPVVSISSLGPLFNDYINFGGLTHPLLYPTSMQHEVCNLNIWQKIVALYEYWNMHSMYDSLEKEEDAIAKRLFGDVPPLRKQMEKIEMLLLNIHPVWEGVRPVPRSVVHLGATHLQGWKKKTEMTEELLQYLDSCNYGLVYVSLGTNIRPWMLPEQTHRKFVSAFSKMSFNVLWKWDADISDLPYNVKIGRWFPQAELLKHPNVRLFITQCGQQSIDEAIAAAVPVLGLPLAADQWRNAEQVKRHKIGTAIDLQDVDDEEFKNIIEHTMRNESYRINIHHLRTVIFDTPAPAPVRAVDAIDQLDWRLENSIKT